MNKTSEKGTKPEKKHVCEECGASFLRPYRLTQHLLLHNNIKTFVCGEKTCNKSYTSKSHLDRHILTVHIKPEIDVINRCPECMKVFSNRQNLKRHLKIKHIQRVVFSCDVCKSNFKKKHLLSTHMYYHTFVKSFGCELCGKEFISLLDKKKHMKYHKTHNCEQCNMAFSHWSKLLKHRKSEHHTKDYNCNDCGRQFKQRRHMVHHAKTHMSVAIKVYPCWFEGCTRVYSRNSNLKQHIRMKHIKERHACEICDAQLSTKAKLKAHLKIHCIGNIPEDVSKQAKTKLTGRKDRKDKGTAKFSTALKIAGILIDPYIEDTKPVKSTETTDSEKAEINYDITVVVESGKSEDNPNSLEKGELDSETSVESSQDKNVCMLRKEPVINTKNIVVEAKDNENSSITEEPSLCCESVLL